MTWTRLGFVVAEVAFRCTPHLCGVREATVYLDRHAQQLRRRGLAVAVHVHEPPVADVAAALDSHAHELGAHLIAMCAHGRSNLRTHLIESIAERILRGGSVPILLRTVRHPQVASFELRKLLVPIDFAHDVQAALAAATALAKPFGATVVLLSTPQPAPPEASRLLPATTALTREFDREQLDRRLHELAQGLRTDIPDVRTIVAEQLPADAILAASSSLPADLIVLVTHAHGRLSGWYEPSTLQQLLQHRNLTLLLIKEL